MSADDATARRLDEQLDEVIALGGGLPAELANDELAQVAHLFLVDAASLEMENERAVRRQLLEQIAEDEQHARHPRVRAPRPGRNFWRVKRVAISATCALVAMSTVALADTKSPAGRAMRSAARAVNIPIPAEPVRAPAKQVRRDERGDDRVDARTGSDGQDATRTDGAIVERDGEGRLLGSEPEGEFVPDGEVQPVDREPMPDGDGGMLPPPDGQYEPRPDGDGGMLPPPDGQYEPPPDGTAPKPIQPAPQPAPGGTAPRPCCQQPAPTPAPQPAPQPQPAPLPQ